MVETDSLLEAHWKIPGQEKLKHFDVLASVDLLRYDLQTQGSLRPETSQRVYDEELSYVAEGINRPLRTEFVLREKDGQLVYFSEGEWQPYTALLLNGLESAKQAAAVDYRKSFLADMAAEDLKIGYQMQALEPGQTMAWHSAFPDRENTAYGEAFMGDMGFQPKRRMGFIYQAERNADRSLVLRSQSVDSSDHDAFEAATRAASQTGELPDGLKAYDDVLEAKTDQKHNSGRPVDSGEIEENAWQAIHQHRDLVEYYFDNLQTLAGSDYASRTELEHAKKRLTYGFWAALKERLDNNAVPGRRASQYAEHQTSGQHMFIQQEVNAAYHKLQARGETLFGCGGAIRPDETLMNAAPSEVFDAIYDGDKTEKKDDGTMYCVNCPECKTFHDKVTKVRGKYVCKNGKCKLAA